MKIEVHGAWGDVIKAQEEAEESVVLAWEGEYRKDDYIDFKGLEPGTFYKLKIDPTIEESLIFVTTDSFRYTIPFYEKKSSYNPMSFVGNRHLVSIRRHTTTRLILQETYALTLAISMKLQAYTRMRQLMLRQEVKLFLPLEMQSTEL